MIRSFVGDVSTIDDGKSIQMGEDSGLSSEQETHSVSDPMEISSGIYEKKKNPTSQMIDILLYILFSDCCFLHTVCSFWFMFKFDFSSNSGQTDKI